MVSLVGQPNHAFSPELLMKALTAGLTMSKAVVQVWKMFQPPWAGGSFLARRATMVDQSMAWMSTLAPIFLRFSAVTRAGACAKGESVGSRMTMGLPSQPLSLRSCLAFSRSCLGAPAAVSKGPPQMKMLGQGLPYFGLPMTAWR